MSDPARGAAAMDGAGHEHRVVVRARGLRKTYGHGHGAVVALDGVDLDVARGELLVVRGRSGSGKSTLLHCLAGIARPDEGQVLFARDDASPGEVDLAALSDDERADLRAARLGLVFQTLNLLPALSAVENVQLPLVLRGLHGDEVRMRAAAALEVVGLAARAAATPAELSGGEQQRVAVARALVGDPALVLADEPTGALDSATESEVLALLRDVVTPDRSVVVVSHGTAAAALADRVVELRDGRVL